MIALPEAGVGQGLPIFRIKIFAIQLNAQAPEPIAVSAKLVDRTFEFC